MSEHSWDPETLAARSRCESTWRAYAGDWRHFESWCAGQGVQSLPASPTTVGRYLAAQGSSMKASTLDRRVTSIVVRHRRAGFPLDRNDAHIADVLAGLRRTLGAATTQKVALTVEEIRAITAALPRSLTGVRDRAILLAGFAGAFRRAELAALERDDLHFTREGVIIQVRRSKSDPEGRGGAKGIPVGQTESSCPVRALKEWLIASRHRGGPLFRRIDRHGTVGGPLSGEGVAHVVKRAVRRWALESGSGPAEADALAEAVGGHSLRAGMITTAARGGASEWSIMATTLHRSRGGLQPYVRLGRLFEDGAAGQLGL